MGKLIRFEKVSYNQYYKDVKGEFPCLSDEFIEESYNNIKLPKRSTAGSAGYDFFATMPMEIKDRFCEAHKYPTGIRYVTDRDDVTLTCYPRSGLGFKYGTALANTVGIIDLDYSQSDNEGHIMVKMKSDISTHVDTGKAFMQGIFVAFLKTDDDCSNNTRNGGFGSTDNNEPLQMHLDI